jgi:hypothetical protein
VSSNCSVGFRCGTLVATRVPQYLKRLGGDRFKLLSPRPINHSALFLTVWPRPGSWKRWAGLPVGCKEYRLTTQAD